MLPFGIVIPSKNSRPYLAAHLAGLQPWLELAAEVVVVDSFSTDGTVEYLRENLAHPNVIFSTHPPGLYASWNHGISQIRSPYFFMATTGDLMSREGILALTGAAEKFNADVVISKPTFHDPQDQPLPDVFWPVDDIIATLKITEPRPLKKLEALAFAVAHPQGALLGSSASNLYRTETFRRLPFPTDFGPAGDGAWAWLHAPEVSWAVVPGRFSSFLIHPKTISSAEKKSYRESKSPSDTLRSAMASWRKSGAIDEREFAALDWEKVMDALQTYQSAKVAFDLDRRARFPWILNPVAWRNRLRRGRAARLLEHSKRRMLALSA